MSGRAWANTPALETLVARALANGADDWTLSAENRTRDFLDEKERLQRLQQGGPFGGTAGVPHYKQLVGGTRKLIVAARIANRDESREVSVDLHVDGGCEIAELVLCEEDVAALDLAQTGEVSEGVQFDGSRVKVAEYERVVVELETDDGQVWRASMHPTVLQTPISATAEEEHAGVRATLDKSRLLGYGGVNRLGLKQDFVHHKLVKAIRRI